MRMVGMMDETADLNWVQSTYPKQVMPGEFTAQHNTTQYINNNNQPMNNNQHTNNHSTPSGTHPSQTNPVGNIAGNEPAEASNQQQQQQAAIADPGAQLLEAAGSMHGRVDVT